MIRLIYACLATIAYTSLLCLIQFQRLNPYALNGPQFLYYYAAVLSIAYMALLLCKTNLTVKFQNAAISLFLSLAALGVVRFIQGMVSNKPVGYLLIMLLFHLIVIAIIKFQIQKDRK